jgi:hypothetical protein
MNETGLTIGVLSPPELRQLIPKKILRVDSQRERIPIRKYRQPDNLKTFKEQ